MITDSDLHWQSHALQLAKYASKIAEVPVGAVLVFDNKIIGKGFNTPISSKDPTAHAEINALREGANAIGNYRLIDTTLYVTLEPCLMCAGAIIHARIKKLIYGAYDKRAGAIVSQAQVLDANFLNHRVNHTGGVLADECGLLLTQFFRNKR